MQIILFLATQYYPLIMRFSPKTGQLDLAPPGYSVGFHSFRVTLVTKLRQAGYSTEIIGGLVGHTNTLQTEHYNRAALAIDINKISYCEAK